MSDVRTLLTKLLSTTAWLIYSSLYVTYKVTSHHSLDVVISVRYLLSYCLPRHESFPYVTYKVTSHHNLDLFISVRYLLSYCLPRQDSYPYVT
jgi:hypothetical protein